MDKVEKQSKIRIGVYVTNNHWSREDIRKPLSEEGLLEIIERHKSLEAKKDDINEDEKKSILLAYGNENVTEGIARLLLTHFPDSARAADSMGR
eukprot:CAMPEP_0201707684 /NCGR_PEP_ID=MMETSP0578-20130828/52827_1 /ASSEMBLY_ACC=CAM_ASM_000663 /TAXON_ID=267565 /ORGANISM="Skeletonema grethea, Strain CCMP 1804" /LENGTH=93 /DNA_ID=CAMNT_0048196369 /DNA_START=1 /DNA_END=280 /DNA_ORIENTATION=-